MAVYVFLLCYRNKGIYKEIRAFIPKHQTAEMEDYLKGYLDHPQAALAGRTVTRIEGGNKPGKTRYLRSKGPNPKRYELRE